MRGKDVGLGDLAVLVALFLLAMAVSVIHDRQITEADHGKETAACEQPRN